MRSRKRDLSPEALPALHRQVFVRYSKCINIIYEIVPNSTLRVLLVFSNKPAKCEAHQINGCQEMQRAYRQTDTERQSVLALQSVRYLITYQAHNIIWSNDLIKPIVIVRLLFVIWGSVKNIAVLKPFSSHTAGVCAQFTHSVALIAVYLEATCNFGEVHTNCGLCVRAGMWKRAWCSDTVLCAEAA